MMEIILWFYITNDPTQKLADLVAILECHHFVCSKELVRQIFKKWRWTWKKASYSQLNKYTVKNIQYYGDYMYWINHQDRMKIKFMDEVHFVPKGIL